MKRQREAAKAYARQDAGGPKKAGALFWSGLVAWSYGRHWPLAVLRADRVALVNGGRYSVTTSRHQGAVNAALVAAGWQLVERAPEELQRLAEGGAP